MNSTKTLELTDEELTELERTLVGRLDLDIAKLIDEAMDEKKADRVVALMHMKEVNQSILEKVAKIPHTSAFTI